MSEGLYEPTQRPVRAELIPFTGRVDQFCSERFGWRIRFSSSALISVFVLVAIRPITGYI